MSTTSEVTATVSRPPTEKTKRELAAEAYIRPQLSNTRRYFMLALFCFADFMDICCVLGHVLGLPAHQWESIGYLQLQ